MNPVRTYSKAPQNAPLLRAPHNQEHIGRPFNRRPQKRHRDARQSNHHSLTSLVIRPSDYFPDPVAANVVRVIPLGGVEEVGRNMAAVEVGNDIFVIDAGFQFTSEENNPGIDYILPNTAYLEKNKNRIRAVIITHGHLDHTGGIPFLLGRFGNPPIYTQALTAVMIRRRQEEFPDVPPLTIIEVEDHSRHPIGSTHVQFFPVTHSIPDAMGVVIETPYGNVVFTGDLKLDHENGVPAAHEVKTWAKLGAQNNLMFIADSTNAEQDGYSIPEHRVTKNLDEIIRTVKGRLIIGTLSSQFERMINIIKTCESVGKKVVTEGRSIRTNIEIAQKVGLLKTEPGTIIPAQAMRDYAPDKIVILSTGAQGEEFGALTRIAAGQNRNVTFTERDTVVLSSSIIPGHELAVQSLKDKLYRYGLTLIHYRTSDVHSTGHANTGELTWINQQVNAKFFMPAYGFRSKTYCHAKAVEQAGRPKESIVIADNGTIIDLIDGERMYVHPKKVPCIPVVVDGFSIGERQEPLMNDRLTFSKDGMFVVVVTVDSRSGRVRKSPDIISRGFVYLRESQQLLHEARSLVRQIVEDAAHAQKPHNPDQMKDELRDRVTAYLLEKTGKTPIVIPVIIGI